MRCVTFRWPLAVVAIVLLGAACRSGDGETGQAEEAAAAEEAISPSTTSPQDDAGQGEMKNRMLIQFARPIEEADLRWLEENGFRVDTVMGERMVRGWLEEPAGGEVIGQDPRISKIAAQMR
jgi:hypothetical protein